VLYFALGYPRFRNRIRAGVPIGIRLDLREEAVLAEHGDACEEANEADKAGETTTAREPVSVP
jgi:toxin CptA